MVEGWDDDVRRMIGTSLSEPHISVTECKTCVYVCLRVAMYQEF